jgi:hypothetical protein
VPGDDTVSLIEIKKLAAKVSAKLGSGTSADAEFLKMLEKEPDTMPLNVESYTKVKMYWKLIDGLLDKMGL